MRLFHPIRFLNLLPLSHMFGQSMATFVPPMLAGTVVFSHGYSPVEIVRQIKSRRISVLVCVPKVLDVLRAHVERARAGDRRAGSARRQALGAALVALPERSSAVRMEVLVHRVRRGAARSGARGLLAQARVSRRPGLRPHGDGADRHVESSVPRSPGTVGKPIAGVEVRIAPDGEILVRGENVDKGVLRSPDERRQPGLN